MNDKKDTSSRGKSAWRHHREENAALPRREFLLKVALPTGIFRLVAFPAVLYLLGQRDFSVLVPGAITFAALLTLFDYLMYLRAHKKLSTGNPNEPHHSGSSDA